MMFLLKAAFWLGLVLVLLPTGSKKQADEAPQISAAEAASAATSAVADLSRFCTRQPETCTVGSQVASILAQRAQDGAAMVYEFISERRDAAPAGNETIPVRHAAAGHADATGSVIVGKAPATIPAAMLPRPRPVQGHDTLTASDRQATWRQPGLRQEARLSARD